MSTQDGNGDLPGGDDALVAEYVLGVLDAATHERVKARIALEPDMQRHAREWQLRLSSMDDGFAEATPPAGAFSRIEARLFGTQERRGPLAALWESLAVWRGIALGALAMALVMVGVTVMRPAPVTPERFATRLVAALEAEGSSVRFMALYDESTGNVRLAALSGEEVPGRDFELWFIEGDQAPQSLGVVPVDSRSEVPLSDRMREEIGAGTVFAITLEPEGGAPEGKPTGPIVAKGQVSFI